MSDGKRGPAIEVGDRLVVVESGIEVTVTKLQIVAVDCNGDEWILEGRQVRYASSEKTPSAIPCALCGKRWAKYDGWCSECVGDHDL